MPNLLHARTRSTAAVLFCIAVVGVAAFAQEPARTPLRVCATIPDLGALAREVGGDDVAVEVFCKPTEDPHFVEAKPGFVKALSQADLFIQAGLELEIGWAPPLLKNARNAQVLPGAPGFLDAASAITPMDVASGPVDRSMGDVHAGGNPHYLLDPLNGLAVASLIRDRLVALRPPGKAGFDARFAAFRSRMGDSLVGAGLAKKYDFAKLALLAERGKLTDFLAKTHEADQLGGWLGAMQPFAGAKAVSDHNMWPYFARRFGVQITGFLEPKPGVPPTTKHLAELVDVIKTTGVKLVLAAPYYDPKHAAFISERSGAHTAAMAHQVGSRAGTADYLAMVDWNVRQVVAALKGPA